MDEIRIGLAGLGHRGLWWLGLLTKIPGFRVVAIYDWIEPLHERALAAIPYREEVKRFTDYGEFLAYAAIDAVGLTVRRRDQGAMAAQALEANKHVNAEVPAAHSIEDCWRIVLAAERTGKLYHLAEQMRYTGVIEAWRDLVARGDLGKVVYVEGQYVGYYGTSPMFADFRTGEWVAVEDLPRHPDAKPTWLHEGPPIHYLPHELSPMLKVLDDRVVEVVGMGTRGQSYAHPKVRQSDIQVALMKTAKDTLLRLAVGFTVPVPHGTHHWYHLHGTKGRVEWSRSERDRPKLWMANAQMHDPAEVDWRWSRTDAPAEAAGSGHGDADYYAHASFRNALLHGKPPELDVYSAMDTAAPAILAADSIESGSRPLGVPDFRPGPLRTMGRPPRVIAHAVTGPSTTSHSSS